MEDLLEAVRFPSSLPPLFVLSHKQLLIANEVQDNQAWSLSYSYNRLLPLPHHVLGLGKSKGYVDAPAHELCGPVRNDSVTFKTHCGKDTTPAGIQYTVCHQTRDKEKPPAIAGAGVSWLG